MNAAAVKVSVFNMPNQMQNHFELFQLPVGFEINPEQLDAAYREIQSRVHPDRFAGASSAEQRIAMQWATRANEAYQTLKQPLKRASYLCQLQGIDLQAECNTAMPMDFLMQQMAWREQLDENRHDAAALHQLEADITSESKSLLIRIAEQLALPDYIQAAQLLRQLMFLEKFMADLDRIVEQHF